MPMRTLVRLAAREMRGAPRRLAPLAASVAVGVAALVAINSFADNVRDSVRRQARTLLGADLALSSRRPLPAAIDSALDDVRRTPGTAVARLTNFSAMVYVPRTTGTRLAQVSAVEGPYPLYGEVRTDPAAAWPHLSDRRQAVVDPSLLSALNARVGDTLALGATTFVIAGAVIQAPGNTGLRAALGPRVFIAARFLSETRLLGFGARVEYEAFVKLPPDVSTQRVASHLRPLASPDRIRLRTPADDQADTNRMLSRLTAYLGLVALIALLLGGVGVASAVTVFVRQRLETVAIFRCLGATGRQVFAIYLMEAALLGVVGSAVGAAAGVGLQQLLPPLLAGFLPVDVQATLSWRAIATGTGMGLWVAAMFALLPLLPVRRVPPLAALRRPYEDERQPRDPWRWLAIALIAASSAAIAALQVGSWRRGGMFTAAVATVILALWLAAWMLVRMLRSRPAGRLPFAWRQGIANLHRPANQTITVVLAIGLGAFLLDTLFLMQSNLLHQLEHSSGPSRPNIALFDIQPDQLPAIERRLRESGLPSTGAVPIVPMRIRSIKDHPTADLLTDTDTTDPADGNGDGDRRGVWALRREYRSTYRDTLVASERIIAGRWWPATSRSPDGHVAISVESGLAAELGVSVGDEIVWDVQGVAVPSHVASLRDVEWARLEPNFFVVFAPGALEGAPQSYVTLTRIDDAERRGRFQREFAEHFANVSTLDLTLVQQSLEQLLDRVVLAVQLTALFTLATGALVLIAALATSRAQRIREGALLRTLGATRGQILRVAAAEYAALGALAAATATGSAIVASWLLARFLFESVFALPALGLGGMAAAVVVSTIAVGLANSRSVVTQPPLTVLRAE